MPDLPPSGLPPASRSPGPPPAPGSAQRRSRPAPAPPAQHPPTLPPRPSRGPVFTAVASLAVALVAVGIAIAAWLRPMPERPASAPPEPSYSDEQIAAAKANICEAVEVATNEVAENSHKPHPITEKETDALAVITNGRLAVYAGGDYLLYRLTTEVGVPNELASSVRSLANTYKVAGIHALNNEPDAFFTRLRKEIDSYIAAIRGDCQ